MKMYRELLETIQVPAEHIYMEWFAPELSNEAVFITAGAAGSVIAFL
jgi:hypothetical protein